MESEEAFTYFGFGKLVCKSTSSLDNGKTVLVTQGANSWSGTMTDGLCVFTQIPQKGKYHVALKNGNTTEYETDIIFNFGEYKEIDVGLDHTSWKGMKAITNADKVDTMTEVGDKISATISGTTSEFMVIHKNYRKSIYGSNVVMMATSCLDNGMQMRTTDVNSGGYGGTLVAAKLDGEYYDGCPDDMKAAISEITFQASVGSQSTNLQNEKHKIWIPLEYNVFGGTTYAAGTEVTAGGAEQFSYFATAANRVMKLGDSGAACPWWLGSPYVTTSTDFCIVTAAGAPNGGDASNSYGVVRCFMIAADKA